jgi:RNA polymerase sigma-70 factor, ECF subfamily
MIGRMDFPLVIRDTPMPETRVSEGALSAMGEDEFRQFYERTARPLWAYLSRITGDRQQADDLLQETYYRFLRAGARHESESHRRNSLFHIATNLVRDAARSAGRRQNVPLEQDDSKASAPRSRAATPESEIATRTDLSRAMEKLEPVQRQLLWLAYAQGASHEEIAEIVGVKTVSVRTLLFRARRTLAALLTGGPAEGVQEEGR